MGLFGPYTYKTKGGKKFWLHVKQRGKSRLFYFSREPAGAIYNLPRGYEVMESPRTSLPLVRKKKGSLFSKTRGGKTNEKEE